MTQPRELCSLSHKRSVRKGNIKDMKKKLTMKKETGFVYRTRRKCLLLLIAIFSYVPLQEYLALFGGDGGVIELNTQDWKRTQAVPSQGSLLSKEGNQSTISLKPGLFPPLRREASGELTF